MIIKFGWELFILWVISYGHAPTHTSIQPPTKKSVPMTSLDCTSLLGNVVCKSMGNTRSTEHNTQSIYGRLKLAFIVPRNSGNRANPENDSLKEITHKIKSSQPKLMILVLL